MAIGTSKGAFHEDEFRHEASPWFIDPKMEGIDNNVIDPDLDTGPKQLANPIINADYKTASPLVTITDEDVDKTVDIGLAFSGGGLGTVTKGNFLKGANDNLKDFPIYGGASKVEQLARKLGEAENGKGSWDRIGGGGQEHYYRDARKALRNTPE